MIRKTVMQEVIFVCCGGSSFAYEMGDDKKEYLRCDRANMSVHPVRFRG